MKFILQLTIYLILFSVSAVLAQSTLSLKNAESIFIQKNLNLLATHYDIDASEAAIIQARLWPNPYISGELNAINPSQNRYIDIGKNGQKTMAIEQLILLGGKRKHEISLAKTNAQMAALEFEELLRNLKFQLHTSYYAVYFDKLAAENLQQQLSNLETLNASYTEQAEKGNVPYKDIVRLQSLTLKFRNEIIQLQANILQEEQELKILLGSDSELSLSPTSEELNVYNTLLTLSAENISQDALAKRPDVQIAKKYTEYQQSNVRLQKSLAIPDLTVGANYDQRGGAFNNQINLTLGMPIPVFHRNQGNIKIAEAQVKQADLQMEQKILEVKAEISNYLSSYNLAYQNYKMLNERMEKSFEEIANGMISNFQKRNISMLEFTDFMESYNNSILNINETKKQLIHAGEALNLATTGNLF